MQKQMRAPTTTDKLSSGASFGFRAKCLQLTQIGRCNTLYKYLHICTEEICNIKL
jgi:hypothetical protein